MTTANVKAWNKLHTMRRHALNYPSEAVVRFLVAARDTIDAKTMLDIGCGAGRHMRLATELGLEPQGIDASSQALNQAAHHGPVQKADMGALPFADGSFDLVVAFGTVYYGTRAETQEAFLEIRRVLRVDGHAFVSLRTERDWRRQFTHHGVFRCADEPEDGMAMNFASLGDMQWIIDEFYGTTCELSEWTTHGMKRLNSDYQIVVRKGGPDA